MNARALRGLTFKPAENGSAERVFAALASAEDRISRLDERARGCGFAEGWRRRSDVRAAIAAMAAEGDVVHPEDLLLHDLGSDIRIPDPAVIRARGILQARRKAQQGGAELLSWGGVAWLTGLARQTPPPGVRPSTRIEGAPPSSSGYDGLEIFFERLATGEAETPRAGVEECLGVLDTQGAPPLLMAAALLEAWRLVDPLPKHRALGPLVAAIFLRAAGRFSAGLFPMEVAFRRRSIPPRLDWASLPDRMSFWLGQMELAADLELDELTRLGHQKALIERKASGARRSNRGPELAALAVSEPVMTTESIALALGITPQASLQLVRRMGGCLHEITGRARYRVWRL